MAKGRKNSGLSKETLEHLLEIHGSFAEIARVHNMNYTTIKVTAHRHGVKNPKPQYERNTSGLLEGREAETEYVASTSETRANLKVTDEEILSALKKYPDKTLTFVASDLKVTKQALSLRIKRLQKFGLL